jgi:hypothetical protein
MMTLEQYIKANQLNPHTQPGEGLGEYYDLQSKLIHEGRCIAVFEAQDTGVLCAIMGLMDSSGSRMANHNEVWPIAVEMPELNGSAA